MTNEGETRQSRRRDRRREVSELVMRVGTIRIEDLAEELGVSVMTIHRDLDELESRGVLRKSRGAATAISTSLVESSDVYRLARQRGEKLALAKAAIEILEPGQAVFLDDSTTVGFLSRLLPSKVPLTVITNTLTLMNELHDVRGVSLVALGGAYYNWCKSFMGRVTTETIKDLRADVLVMSTAAIADGVCLHQYQETVAVKRAMFDSAGKRILLADHTKFRKRALYGMVKLAEFDHVIVDAATEEHLIDDIRRLGVNVIVADEHRSD